MNVGSILNDDTPPSDVESAKRGSDANPQSQRSSITNLLNDERPNKSRTPKKSVSPQKSPEAAPKSPTPQSNGKSPANGKAPASRKPSANRKPSEDKVEIEKLRKLKLSKKPTRYKNPPIWAQEYTPSAQNTKVAAAMPPVAMDSALTEKSVFDYSSTASVDLECSVTGVIPPPSITRTIAEWVYANFVEITDDNRRYVELELKFGTIMDRRSNQRIDIHVSTECVYTDVSNIFFEPGMHEMGFNELDKFLSDLERQGGEAAKGDAKPKRKFNTLVTDVTDSIFHISNRNEAPKSIRISKDNNLTPPRYIGINKQRISDLYIHNPSSMYDLRLSLSLELPVSEEQVTTLVKKQKPNLTRIKQRTSYGHKPTVTTFDLTKVTTPKESRNTGTGKRIVENEKSFELELEIDSMELFRGFDQFKSGQNSIRFEELVEIFVNNARVLNNRITKLAK